MTIELFNENFSTSNNGLKIYGRNMSLCRKVKKGKAVPVKGREGP
jgi:hypothetical protein